MRYPFEDSEKSRRLFDHMTMNRGVFANEGVKYSEKHDAHYDLTLDIWLEKNCGDPTCDFCKDRPERPSQAKAN